ncbi:hypothetical protein IJ541_11540 [bacterium]|nr:hypothetical protein [bacterium]
MDKNSNNEMMMLGVGILIIGLILAIYSISTYVEIKDLGEKIDFEMIDDNNQLSSTDKYYKYLAIADFLKKKLEKNKNIPIKNSSCIYLDYAQHNAIELYRLTSKKMDSDITKKNVAAGNIRTLYNALDNYKTCKKSYEYKTELGNLLDEIEKADKLGADREERMNNFLNGSNYEDILHEQGIEEQITPETTEQYEEYENPGVNIVPEKNEE